MNQYELDMEYIRLVNEWYVTNGLFNHCKKDFRFLRNIGIYLFTIQPILVKQYNYCQYLYSRYIPLEDLYQIYKLYYGREIMPRRVIEACTSILLLER